MVETIRCPMDKDGGGGDGESTASPEKKADTSSLEVEIVTENDEVWRTGTCSTDGLEDSYTTEQPCCLELVRCRSRSWTLGLSISSVSEVVVAAAAAEMRSISACAIEKREELCDTPYIVVTDSCTRPAPPLSRCARFAPGFSSPGSSADGGWHGQQPTWQGFPL